LKQVILYTTFTSNRLSYILSFIFNEVLGIGFQHTTSIEELNNSPLCKINYSHENIEADITIVPVELLSKKTLENQDIDLITWQKNSVFFKTSDNEIPFDIFAASFFLLSRYEEYLPHNKDEYGRYSHKESTAFKYNFLHLPLVDIWLQEFKSILKTKNASLVFTPSHFNYLPTYDIDIAYSYMHKGFKRNLGGVLKDTLKGKFNLAKMRINVLKQKQKDPYDTYDYLDALHKKYNLSPIYFFLVGQQGKYDKNIPITHTAMQSLIKNTAEKYAIGIHPSFQSNWNNEALVTEINSLSTVAKPISKNRQHYIYFDIQTTFSHLISLQITDDYSMGYGSINGFRASTSHSHNWFDVKNNEVTSLRMHPFCYMEANSFFEQKMNCEEASEELNHYKHIVKKVNGTLITIWHNFSLGEEPQWIGWREVYEKFLEKV
jgi:hypothetical protein